MTPLPILVTVPHGGIACPPEAAVCRLSSYQFALDGDTWVRELFDLRGAVAAFMDTPVPRAVIDLNRAPEDRPPANPDGVVKSVTVDGTQVWPEQNGPPADLTELLIDRYHTPWHQEVAAQSASPGLVLGIDCHTMLAFAPRGSGIPRPLICLGNRGDLSGRPTDEPLTAPEDLTHLLLDNLIAAFRHLDVDVEVEKPPMRLNDPFRGGYISRHHAAHTPLPWIQLELSRALYLPPHFGPIPGDSEMSRLKDLQGKVIAALERTF
jgi:N-formylglutamate deformylase